MDDQKEPQARAGTDTGAKRERPVRPKTEVKLREAAETIEARVQVETFMASVIEQFGGITDFAKHVHLLAENSRSESIRARITSDLMRIMVAMRKDQGSPEDDDTEDLEAELQRLRKEDGQGRT